MCGRSPSQQTRSMKGIDMEKKLKHAEKAGNTKKSAKKRLIDGTNVRAGVIKAEVSGKGKKPQKLPPKLATDLWFS